MTKDRRVVFRSGEYCLLAVGTTLAACVGREGPAPILDILGVRLSKPKGSDVLRQIMKGVPTAAPDRVWAW